MTRIRWGILGNAKIAREWVIPALLQARNAQLVALASRDAGRGREVCDRFGIPRCFSDYDALLACPDVDAVYVPLPNTLHVEWTRRALEAGKHVLCEKPLALRAEDIDDLLRLRDRTGLVAGEAFMVAHHPQWAHVRQLLAAGRIGRLRVVEGAFTYRNVDADNIRNRADLGGGGLRDIGVYPVVCTRLATGLEPLWAQARLDIDPAFGTDRFAHGLVGFEGFELAFYCGTQAALRQQMVFHGDDGWIRLEAPFTPGAYELARVLLRPNDGGALEETIFPRASQYQIMVENFGDAVTGTADLAFPLEHSRANQRVIDMLFDAAETRR